MLARKVAKTSFSWRYLQIGDPWFEALLGCPQPEEAPTNLFELFDFDAQSFAELHIIIIANNAWCLYLRSAGTKAVDLDENSEFDLRSFHPYMQNYGSACFLSRR